MKTHHLHCHDPWFSLIRSGDKRVEGRKNLPMFRHWRVGDIIIFRLRNEEFSTKIVDLRRYQTLDEYLISEGSEKVLPGVSSVENARKIYLQWSTPDEIEKFGFLAIEVSLLSKVHPLPCQRRVRPCCYFFSKHITLKL